MKIKAEQLADTINHELSSYVEDAQDVMKDAVLDAGKEAVKELKEKSPKRTGRYAKSWAVKKVKESTTELDTVVHSRKLYGLTHLLENGHAKRGGGRVQGISHIKPVEENVTSKLEKDIRHGLQGKH
jgi:NAD-dependent DNA ligase